MTASDKVKWLVKELIYTYVDFVHYKGFTQDVRYLKLGIDESYEEYEGLFFTVLKSLVKADRTTLKRYPKQVVKECVTALESKLKSLGELGFCVSYGDVIYDTCRLTFRFITEGVRACVEV